MDLGRNMGVAGRHQSGRRVLAALIALGAAIVALALPTVAWGAAGDLDPSFSGDGIVTSSNAYQGGGGGPVAIDSQGRIVVSSETSIERYRPNGTPDPSLSGDGRIQTDFIVQSIAVDSQDRIVAAGYANNPADPKHDQVFAVGRFRVNGTPDPSFSGDGLALTPIGGGGDDQASAVAVDGQGRIVAAGHSYKHPAGTFFALARYMPNGNPDTSFSGDGQLQTEFPNVQNAFGQDVALASRGRIVVAGRTDDRFAVARYGPHGGLDPSFSGDGMLTTAMAANASAGETVAVDDSDRILVGGLASFTDPSKYEFALARYRPNGALDPSFSGDGKAYTSFGRDRSDDTGLAIDDQGRIVAAGWTFDEDNSHSAFALARYTPGGALDPTFSGNGRVTTKVGPFSFGNGVALDANGKIVVAGYASAADLSDPRITVARYLGG